MLCYWYTPSSRYEWFRLGNIFFYQTSQGGTRKNIVYYVASWYEDVYIMHSVILFFNNEFVQVLIL